MLSYIFRNLHRVPVYCGAKGGHDDDAMSGHMLLDE